MARPGFGGAWESPRLLRRGGLANRSGKRPRFHRSASRDRDNFNSSYVAQVKHRVKPVPPVVPQEYSKPDTGQETCATRRARAGRVIVASTIGETYPPTSIPSAPFSPLIRTCRKLRRPIF